MMICHVKYVYFFESKTAVMRIFSSLHIFIYMLFTPIALKKESMEYITPIDNGIF